jgi:hypothetical protein
VPAATRSWSPLFAVLSGYFLGFLGAGFPLMRPSLEVPVLGFPPTVVTLPWARTYAATVQRIPHVYRPAYTCMGVVVVCAVMVQIHAEKH